MKNTKNAPVWARFLCPGPPHLPQHETYEKCACLGIFFVSGTTTTYLTSHNMKHMKNAPVWVRFSCLGLPPPMPPPTSCQTRRTCLYGHVLSVCHLPHPAEHIRHTHMGVSYVFICFSPHKHKKHAHLGVFLVVGTLPLSSNIKDAPKWCVFGGRCLPSPTPHPQPLKTSCRARFQGDNHSFSSSSLSSLLLIIPLDILGI